MKMAYKKHMKITRLITIAALSTTIIVGGQNSAFAEEAEGKNEIRNVETDGKITFTSGGNDKIEVLDPDNNEDRPNVDLKPIVPDTTGPLTIATVPQLNFGEQEITNKDKTYNMVAEKEQLKGTEGTENQVPYVSFAQVHDTRGSNAGWDLKVRLSEFEAPEAQEQNRILKGAMITFVNGEIEYNGMQTENKPSAHHDGLTLSPGGSRSVMWAEESKGAGVSSVVWGDSAAIQAQDKNGIVENEAIKLSVPGNTVKDAKEYKATLSWELEATPGNGNDETSEGTN